MRRDGDFGKVTYQQSPHRELTLAQLQLLRRRSIFIYYRKTIEIAQGLSAIRIYLCVCGFLTDLACRHTSIAICKVVAINFAKRWAKDVSDSGID